MKKMKHLFWIAANLYGAILGHPWLSGLHSAFLNLSAHGLGFDNCAWNKNTGETWFVKKILKRHSIRYSLDIGANIGRYAAMLVANTNSVVWAMEPNPSSYKKLTAREEEKIIPFQMAISDTEGVMTLYSPGEYSETASLDKNIVQKNTSTIRVPVTTVDAFIATHAIQELDFIKIDTEGFEYEVLHGAQQTIKNLAPLFIQFEFNLLHLRRGITLLSISELLPDYSFYRLLPHGWIRIRPNAFSSNLFMYCNIIAVRNNKQ